MADIAGSYNSNQSYNPKFVYTISYSQSGRSATAVTYNFTVNMTRTNGSYGYDIKINWNIGGVTGNKTILAVNSGAASASTTFSVTVPTNADGGTLSARIYTSSSTDGTHSQNIMDTGNQTVNKSTFNTAPTLSGTVTADGTTSNKYIPENKASIAISWPAATDPNNNLSGYRIRVSINGGGWTDLATTNASTRSYTHTVSGYGEGTTFRYAVDSYDSYSARSSFIYSPTLTKNKFTGSSITSSGSITFSTTSISFTVGASSNTDGSGTSGRYITCNGVTVHNNTIGTGTVTVTIYKSGTTPGGPYVKFDDIKSALSGKNYMGTFSFNVLSTNAYGTNRTSSVSVWIDLRTTPNTTTNVTIAKNSNSTAYRTITATGNSYFIPDGTRTIYVSWGAGSGKLGEAISYQVYVSIGGGSWTLVSDRQTGLNYTYRPSKLNASSTIKFKIRTITAYDYYSDTDSAAENLHYYNSPGLTHNTITRTATAASIPVTVKSASSIPNINTVGTWVCYNKGTSTSVSSGSLTTAQTAQTVSVTNLTENGQYDLKITYRDNTGFSTDVVATIVIGANSPIFFVNQYGIGVNGLKANSTNAINVAGRVKIGNGIELTTLGAVDLNTNDSTALWVSRTLGTAPNFPTAYSTILNIGAAGNSNFQLGHSYGNLSEFWVRGRHDTSGNYTPWARVYTTQYKPTAADVGALASGGKAVSATQADKVVTSNGGGIYQGNGDAASETQANVQIKSWFGIGFGPSIPDQPVPENQNSHVMNVRNGDMSMRGTLYVGGNIVASGSTVVSSGNNDNGRWVRFYDGTQICYVYRTVSLAVNNAYGNLYQNTNTWTFPATFTTEPVVNVARNRWGTSASWGTGAERTTTGATIRIIDNVSRAAGTTSQEIIAIGRWK